MRIKLPLLKIDKEKCLMAFLFICMYEPKLLVKYKAINAVYIMGAVICFLTLLCYQLKSHKCSKVLLICIAYRLSFGLQTVLSKGDVLMWGYMSLVITTLCMAIDQFSRHTPRKLLGVIVSVLSAILTVNLIVSIFYPQGVIDEIYFIGIRTRFTDVIFTLIALTLMLDNIDGKKISMRTIYCSALCIFHIVRFWIATAILGMFVFVLCYILLSKKKLHLKILNTNFVMAISLIASILLVTTNIIDVFSWLIQGILGKSLTLSGRTQLWQLSRNIILQHPIFGHGMAIDGNFIPSYYRGAYILRQAHNQWIQIMYDGGLVTTALFVWLISLIKKPIDHNLVTSNEATPLCAALIAFFVMMLSEIYSYNPYIYTLIFIAYYVRRFELQKSQI